MKKIIDRQKIINRLIDPKSNKRLVGITTYCILAVVSTIMTVLNIITHKGLLTWSTAIFAALCVLNFILAYCGTERTVNIASLIFAVELCGLFVFFLLSGNPEGFSAIWICMAPPIGMLFYDLKKGSVFCSVVFAGLVFFLWTPLGKELLPVGVYTESFEARFPLLYLAFFTLAFFLQLLRVFTWRQLDRQNKLLAKQAVHDQLTEIYNRQGIFDAVKKRIDENTPETLGAIIFDIDHFKIVNDTYGHGAGDLVLVRFAQILRESLNADVGRWGGEEFAAFYYNDNVTPEDVNNVLKRIENEQFIFDGKSIRVTCSAGVCETSSVSFESIITLIKKADSALYVSKESGRNCVSYSVTD